MNKKTIEGSFGHVSHGSSGAHYPEGMTMMRNDKSKMDYGYRFRNGSKAYVSDEAIQGLSKPYPIVFIHLYPSDGALVETRLGFPVINLVANRVK